MSNAGPASGPKPSVGVTGARPARVVQLHFGRFVHPIYREQMHAIPDGFLYRATHPALEDETTPTKRIVEQRARFAATRTLGERLALRLLSRAGYVHRVRAPRLEGAALIHSAERLLHRAPLPYVVDFEHAELFVLYQRLALSRPWARHVLASALDDERLRFLLPWSEMASRSLEGALGADVAARLRPRTRVVYPALRQAAERPPARVDRELRVLFVGTAFYEKGAVEAIRAVQRVAATHPIHLDLLSYVPDDWAQQLRADPAITLHRPGGADVVRNLYRRAHAFLFPSHMDTFGYVALEAMAHGLPVLAPRYLTQAELVRDEVTGLLFPGENPLYGEDTRCRFRSTLPPPRAFLEALRSPSEPYVEGIAGALRRLVDDPDLHHRLAAAALAEVAEGRFSIARRREALGEIYESALE
ncbi:MAG TPA: glycosyltransferase family 4 protein [Solirubrobacteraceae bacterium]|nr:glycosyltransferase family 4 protein [Solirubrobacteraceae bacterium]